MDTPPDKASEEPGQSTLYSGLTRPLGPGEVWWTVAILWFAIVAVGWTLFFKDRAKRAELTAERVRWVNLIQTVNEPRSLDRESPQPTAKTQMIDGNRLANDLSAFSHPRYTDSELSRARAFIGHRLVELGYTPTITAFGKGVTLIADLKGQDPTAGRYVIAAHLDSVANSPGADDNATGVVGLLELARVFKARPPRSSLRFIFFDGEERGLLGSRNYVRSPKNLMNVRGVIVLEMIGYTCDQPGCQGYPDGIPSLLRRSKGQFVAVVGNTEHLNLMHAFRRAGHGSGIDVVAIPVPNQGHMMPDTRRSDHSPFWDHGIGAVMVTDTANFRNPHYHTANDRPETIDMDFFRNAVELVYRSVSALSNAAPLKAPK